MWVDQLSFRLCARAILARLERIGVGVVLGVEVTTAMEFDGALQVSQQRLSFRDADQVSLGMHKGAKPSCGGSCKAAWGEPARPAFPRRGNGKGEIKLSSLPQA